MVDAVVPTVEGAMRKKAYHHGDLRNAIIQEATARARVSGEKAIVLREIAPAIGVSATAAYRHFTNRQQLVEEVSARGFVAIGEFIERPSLAGATVDPALAAYADLRNAALATVQFAIDEPAWTRMMMEALGTSEVVAEGAWQVFEIIQRIIDRGIGVGVFVPGTRIREAQVLWAGIDGLCSHAMFGINPMDTPESVRISTRTIDLCMTDMLTQEGVRVRDEASLPDGIVTELPR